MRSFYVDFINHGILPFVGRGELLSTLLTRWETIAQASSLQMSLISGEMGTGKSRFIEELEPKVMRSGGLVINAKLYPESTNSIAPLLARAIRFMKLRRNLPVADPAETIHGVAEAIRRLTQIRPTLLLIEDIHLLSGDTMREFAGLLGSLSEAPMLVLATARPIAPTVRAAIERYLSDDLELPPLTFQEIQAIWDLLFNTPLPADAAKLIEETTGGNPLAIRTILRGSLKSGEIAATRAGQQWQISVPLAAFRDSLRRQMGTLIDGIAAHLSPTERAAAETMAGLGEVFSLEAARLLLPNADSAIDSLVFKGVLVAAGHSPSILPQTAPALNAFSFTHTLLHRRFVQDSNITEHQLVRLVCSRAPLCTVLPFRLLSAVPANFAIPLSEISTAMTNAAQLARTLDRTSDWQWALPIWDSAAALWQRHFHRWNHHDQLSLELELLMHRMALLRRNEQGEEYRLGVERLLELTSTEQLPEDLLRYRLLTIIYQDIYRSRIEQKSSLAVRKNVMELVERYPQLRHTNGYLFYLSHLAHTYSNSVTLMQEVEQIAEELLLDTNAPDEFRQELQQQVLPTFLLGFATKQQLERRVVFANEYEALCRAENRFVDRSRFVIFYAEIGQFEKAQSLANEILPSLISRGLIRSLANCQIHQLCFQLAENNEWNGIDGKLKEIFLSVPDDYHSGIQRHAVLLLMNFGILLNRPDKALQQLQWFQSPERLPLYLRVFIGLSSHQLQPLLAIPPQTISAADSPLWQLLQLLAGENSPDIEQVWKLSIGLLNAELLRVYDITQRCVVADLLWDAHHRGVISAPSKDAQEAIDASLHGALSWLQERNLQAMVHGVFSHIQRYLSEPVKNQWQKTLGTNAIVGNTDKAEHGGGHLEVKVIGDIATGNTATDLTPLRGQRTRTLLALMVANQLMDQPMTLMEFSYVIAGNEHLSDVDRSRKLLNSTVFRLREIIGHQFVLTDQEVPRLNPENVTIDLLEATQLLRQSDTALRQGALPAAYQCLMLALDKFDKNIIFPELYDTFFEALRDDVENERRDLILRASQALLKEGDPRNAEDILQRGFHSMPDDEEIAALLCETLTRNGKRVQAQRVKMKLREAIANN